MINVSCVFLKLLYCPVGINIILVVLVDYYMNLDEYIINILLLY